MIERLVITDRATWLEWRKKDVTASVVGALFGFCPYDMTALRLYVEKQGLVELPTKPENSAMRRGRIMEPAVKAAAAEDRPEWEITKATEYFRDPDIRLGCTPDFWINNDPRGLGVLQAKTVAPSVFEREWQDGMPPMWIVLQVATEMMLSDARFGVVGVLIDDRDKTYHPYEIPRDPRTEDRIRAAVKKFWGDIEAGNQPEADYGLDRELLAALSPREAPETKIDLTGDNEVTAGLIDRAAAKADIKRLEERCQQVEALLMDRMGDAAIATADEFRATWKIEQRSGYTVAPKSSRVLRIYDRRSQ